MAGALAIQKKQLQAIATQEQFQQGLVQQIEEMRQQLDEMYLMLQMLMPETEDAPDTAKSGGKKAAHGKD